jgi:hypothetical protein
MVFPLHFLAEAAQLIAIKVGKERKGKEINEKAKQREIRARDREQGTVPPINRDTRDGQA